MNVCAICVFGSKVWPRTFGCVDMGNAVLFMLRSRLLLYSARSGVNIMQVVLAALVLVCVDVMVMSYAYVMT